MKMLVNGTLFFVQNGIRLCCCTGNRAHTWGEGGVVCVCVDIAFIAWVFPAHPGEVADPGSETIVVNRHSWLLLQSGPHLGVVIARWVSLLSPPFGRRFSSKFAHDYWHATVEWRPKNRNSRVEGRDIPTATNTEGSFCLVSVFFYHAWFTESITRTADRLRAVQAVNPSNS